MPLYWRTDLLAYWPKQDPDLLDFYVCKDIGQNYLQLISVIDLSSDHTPTLLTVSTSIIFKEEVQGLYNKHTNWDLFGNDINDTIVLNIKNAEQIEISIEHFNKAIQTAA